MRIIDYWLISIYGCHITLILLWEVVGTIFASISIVIALLAWLKPKKGELKRKYDERFFRMEHKLNLIEKHLNKRPYIDGLIKAKQSVYERFAKGAELMTEHKWNDAIREFKQALKRASCKQSSALHSLIGRCYQQLNQLDLALQEYRKSLILAKECGDEKGVIEALDHLKSIYKIKRDSIKRKKVFKIKRTTVKTNIISYMSVILIFTVLLLVIPFSETQNPDFFRGLNVYTNELDSASSQVVVPFEKGMNSMNGHEWDDAIREFKEAMKEAVAQELVALYDLIGICYYSYYIPSNLDSALIYFAKSLNLAIQFNDKKGEVAALENLSRINVLIYHRSGYLKREFPPKIKQ